MKIAAQIAAHLLYLFAKKSTRHLCVFVHSSHRRCDILELIAAARQTSTPQGLC